MDSRSAILKPNIPCWVDDSKNAGLTESLSSWQSVPSLKHVKQTDSYLDLFDRADVKSQWLMRLSKLLYQQTIRFSKQTGTRQHKMKPSLAILIGESHKINTFYLNSWVDESKIYSAEAIHELRNSSKSELPSLLQLRSADSMAYSNTSFMKTGRNGVPSKDNIGSYDDRFRDHMAEHGIYSPNYYFENGNQPPKPANFGVIRNMVQKNVQHPDLSPARWQEFMTQVKYSKTSTDVVNNVLPFITNLSRQTCKDRFVQTRCRNLEPLGDRFPEFRPDGLDGEPYTSLPEEIINTIGLYVLANDNNESIITPNFFVEVKGVADSELVARLQCTAAGAIGARAMFALQNYPNGFKFDNEAKTLSWHFKEGQLNIYCSHVEGHDVNGNEGIQIYTNVVGRYHLDDSYDDFYEGVQAYRNASQWTKDIRQSVISELKQRLYASSSSSVGSSANSSFSSMESTVDACLKGFELLKEGSKE